MGNSEINDVLYSLYLNKEAVDRAILKINIQLHSDKLKLTLIEISQLQISQEILKRKKKKIEAEIDAWTLLN